MFTDVTDLCDSEAEDGDLDLESTAFSDNTDFAERTLRTQGDVPQALGTVVQYVKATCGDNYKANVTSSNKEGVPRQRTSRGVGRKRGEGRGASRRATLNGVARDSPGLVHQAGRRGAYVGNRGARRVEAGQRGGLRQAAAAWPFGRYRRYPALPGTERN